MNKSIFAILFILSALNVFGQNSYVIKTKGDSLSGKISLLLPGKAHEELQIKIGKKRERIKAYEVRKLMIGEDTYHTVQLDNVYKFMLLEKEGYASLYKYRAAESFEFNSQYISKKGGEGAEVPNFSFKKIIGEFMSDCPEVKQKIDDRSFRKSDISEIVETYNTCIGSGEVYAYRVLKKTAEDSGELALVIGLMGKVKASTSNSELLTLLGDIKTKIENGDVVPKYLKSALKDQTSDMKDLKNEVNELLKKLPK